MRNLFQIFLTITFVGLCGTRSMQAQVPPANDAFNQREVLAGFTNTVWANNALASFETGESLPPSCDPSHKTLWWSFTTPAEGVLQINSGGVSNNVAWAVYHGSNVANLQMVAYSCTLPLSFTVQSNETFQIAVDGAFGASGTLWLNVNFSVAPPNDAFTKSVHLEGTNLTYTGNFTAATIEPNEPNPGAENTIWMSWAAPLTGRARFSSVTTPYQQYVEVYTGPAVESLQPVRWVGMDNSRFDFLARAGTVYHFQMAGGADNCTLSVQTQPYGPCLNDNFSNAAVLAGQNVNQGIDQDWYPLGGASAELGEPSLLGATPFKSLWWRWRAPNHGTMRFFAERSLTTNVVLGVYSGSSLEALTLLRKGTNNLAAFGVTGGNDYYITAAVPTNTDGDVLIYGQYSTRSSASMSIPGNLLREPSWEGTAILGAQYWGMAGSIGGAVNEIGGCDGTTWPALSGGARVWQDFATVPGRKHQIRFAVRASDMVGGGSGNGQVRVLWDHQEIGVAILPVTEVDFWHWIDFTTTATGLTSRVEFVNLGRNVELDAFSVVSLTQPPQIVNPPVSASVIAGGAAAFTMGVSGSSPLTYQWFFNGASVSVGNSPGLVLEGVTTNQAGSYLCIATNPFGSVTSAPISLMVETPTIPVILWQPYGDTVGVGGYLSLSVVAAGSTPLSYQWFKNGAAVAGATNRVLIFGAVDYTNAGIYSVQVRNPAGTAGSLGAKLVVVGAVDGGGTVQFVNRVLFVHLDAPIFDIDGWTRLNGSNYLVQLYAGLTLESLRPVGEPSPFRTGFNEGYFSIKTVTIPTVPPQTTAVVQVRAWDATKGSSYEEARALGGKFGKSELMSIVTGGGLAIPPYLTTLQSFSLAAGRSQFATGRIQFQKILPEGFVVWTHQGEPGFRYLIEKSFGGLDWKPFGVITNLTSTTTFSDSIHDVSAVTFYRSRILD